MGSKTSRRGFLGVAATVAGTGMITASSETAAEAQEMKFEAGKNTHENVAFVCAGGMSNAGLTTALAGIEAVKQLGLQRLVVGCLAGLPTNVPGVYAKAKAARKVITVDGCPNQCARKTVEKAGFHIGKALVLTRDIGLQKKVFHEDIGGELKGVMEYVSDEDVAKAKALICRAVNER